MRIAAYDIMHCQGAGSRTWSFLKVTTDAGVTGWAEFTEHAGSAGALGGVIRALISQLGNEDVLAYERVRALLDSRVRQAPGGLGHRAAGAIENALVDIRARTLGVPAYALAGGPARTRIPLYWSHCGLHRVRGEGPPGTDPVTSLAGLEALGREVTDRGFQALKANIYRFGQGRGTVYTPAWGGPGWPELNAGPDLIAAVRDQVAALRAGAGDSAEIAVDLNFHFKPEGYRRIARALDGSGVAWLEIDTPDPGALLAIRSASPVPVASGETLHGRRAYRGFLEAGAMDTAVVDVAWNGYSEALKIAAMCDAYDVNVAPHNYAGPLMAVMSAHLAAAVPNLRLMEYDVDTAPHAGDLVSPALTVAGGELELPAGPGWGCELDEDAIRKHGAR